ncbi:MAG TPA: AMP-binding protein [Burkholderiaceae bacterium]|nr:AMP-binding protein [Burkholderiaceae bacterium]
MRSSVEDRAPRDGWSHVVGAAVPPLSEQTIPAWLDDTAARYPNRAACVFREQGVRWTWQELRQRADRFAAALLRLGFEKGDRIGIWSPNRSEWVVAQYATARIGIVLVNINPAYRLAELEYALNKVACKGIVSAPAFKASRYLEMLQTLAPELSTCEPGRLRAAKLPALRTVIRMGDERSDGMFNFDQVLALADDAGVAEARRLGAALACQDAINVQFTSGTTGNPKGATLTHYNIVNNARDVARMMNFGAGDILCIPVPLYHCFGMVMSSLACTVTGGTMVYPSEGFDPLATLRAVHEERCTHLHGVPTMFIAELEAPGFADFDLSSLRGGIMAGSPCPVEVMKRVNTQMHMTEVTIAYGMTETSPVSFQSSVDDPLDKRVSTVGRVMPHLEVKIIDNAGRTVRVGQPGELCTKGYSVMRGYWDDAERTAAAVVDGWMHTGDLATLDAQGYCNIVGRVKDMLIRGGENVYPREVEEFLFRHPAVAQVQVFGVPDPKYGEEVCAWIVLKAGATTTEQEIRDFCRDQIAHYKVPRYVRFVPAVPMTVTGKAQKFVMRQQMIEELGLVEARTA